MHVEKQDSFSMHMIIVTINDWSFIQDGCFLLFLLGSFECGSHILWIEYLFGDIDAGKALSIVNKMANDVIIDHLMPPSVLIMLVSRLADNLTISLFPF